MSARMPALLLAMALLTGPVVIPERSLAKGTGVQDSQILAAASIKLRSQTAGRVIRWLHHVPSVDRVSRGRDHVTLDVRFRDGLHALILPSLKRNVRLKGFTPQLREQAPSGLGVARAAVWEPFASELGLGLNAGNIEVQDLQSAGFQVDQAYDTAVNVSLMASLARYNVVYMHTHSGVSASGDGVLATGEPASGDPTVQPLLQNGSVLTVAVAGSGQLYYGITSRYIQSYEAQFPASSLLFLNGCALLRASMFWQALSERGAGVMVSWDANAAARDDYLSAAAFFNEMEQGQSVAGAISALRSAGYGSSSDNGVPATLGYLGDGSITLQQAASSAPRPGPTPTATSMPVFSPTATPAPPPTAVPTVTPTALPTKTSTSAPTRPPVPVRISLKAMVRAGSKQTIDLQQLSPQTALEIRVIFPNGDQVEAGKTSDASGRAALTYVQPGSKITRNDRIARVEITATTPSGKRTDIAQYVIGLGAIDVVAQPRRQRSGRLVTIFVHTRRHAPVTVSVQLPHSRASQLHGVTGDRGWLRLAYRLRRSLGPAAHAVVRARVRIHHKVYQATTTFGGM